MDAVRSQAEHGGLVCAQCRGVQAESSASLADTWRSQLSSRQDDMVALATALSESEAAASAVREEEEEDEVEAMAASASNLTREAEERQDKEDLSLATALSLSEYTAHLPNIHAFLNSSDAWLEPTTLFLHAAAVKTARGGAFQAFQRLVQRQLELYVTTAGTPLSAFAQFCVLAATRELDVDAATFEQIKLLLLVESESNFEALLAELGMGTSDDADDADVADESLAAGIAIWDSLLTEWAALPHEQGGALLPPPADGASNPDGGCNAHLSATEGSMLPIGTGPRSNPPAPALAEKTAGGTPLGLPLEATPTFSMTTIAEAGAGTAGGNGGGDRDALTQPNAMPPRSNPGPAPVLTEKTAGGTPLGRPLDRFLAAPLAFEPSASFSFSTRVEDEGDDDDTREVLARSSRPPPLPFVSALAAARAHQDAESGTLFMNHGIRRAQRVGRVHIQDAQDERPP